MRSLAATAFGVLAGAWAAGFGLRIPGATMGCVALLGAALLMVYANRLAPERPAPRRWPILFGLGFWIGQALVLPTPAQPSLPEGVVRLEGEVVRTRHAPDAIGMLRVEAGSTLRGIEIPVGMRVDLRGLDRPAGERVRVLARVRPSTRFENPTPHPAWPLSGQADARGRVISAVESLREAPWHEALLHAARRRIRRMLDETLSPTTAGLVRALLLGEAGAIDRERSATVRNAGLTHVLAVSGLHVTLLAGTLLWFMRRGLAFVGPLSRRVDVARVAHGVAVPLALAYAALVGDSPSAWRAAVTAGVGWSLAAVGRRAHPVAVAAAAVLILGVVRPDDLTRPGFILSIAATAALISAPAQAVNPVRAAITVTGRAMIATAPITLWMFSTLPLVGLIANLVVVPFASICLLPLAAIHTVIGLVLPGAAVITAAPLEAVSRAFYAASEVFAATTVGQDLPPLDALEGIVVMTVAIALLAVRRPRSILAVLIVGALAFVGAEMRLSTPPDNLQLTFLDVGQGDATLIDLPDGRLMVVDAGGAIGGGLDPGEEVLVPLLRARRRKRIDVFVLSHPHPDHYGGMRAVFDALEVGEVWDSGQADAEEPEGAVAALLRDARARGIPVRTPETLCQGPRAFGEAVIRVHWPCPGFDSGWDPNENSLVLEIEYANRHVLLTGDAERHTEAVLASRLGPMDILKVAHHGSRTSTGEAFLARVSPSIAVASAGRDNRFDHPHREVWDRLTREVAQPYRTDRHGGVSVEIHADGRIETDSAR